LQFSYKQLQILERKDYGCSKVPICPQISPTMKIISARIAQNKPNLHESCTPWQQLHGCAKKLRSATSQFFGGTNYVYPLHTGLLLLLAYLHEIQKAHSECRAVFVTKTKTRIIWHL